MYSMGQEFGQGSAGMAHLCSTMSEASAGEPIRDIRDSIWLGAGVILRLFTQRLVPELEWLEDWAQMGY